MTVDQNTLKTTYLRSNWKKTVIIVSTLLVIVLLFFVSIYVNGRDISFFNCIDIVISHLAGETYEYNTDRWWDDYILWKLSVPRAILAIIAGAGLAVGGAAMQGVMKNPLADPYTTGISSATVLGVAIAMVMGYSVTGPGQYGVVLNAFVFGLIPVVGMLAVSKVLDSSPASLILFGVIISAMFGAISTLVMVMADDMTLQSVYAWQVGSLYDSHWGDLPLPLTITAVCTVSIMFTSGKMNLLLLGDDSAHSLGLNVENYRIILLALVSLMTASIVCFTGILGFVGLVVPHMVRMIFGSDNRFLIPLSAVFGSFALIAADIVSRTVIYPNELQVGVVLAFLGAPLFLYVIVRNKRTVW
ncbi:MAG: iron ABC transporter permease [archaeon]|nr:iron ABC transporter permease [archaeon]